MFAKKVQNYLSHKIKEHDLSNKILSQKLNISTSLVSEFTKARKPYPSIFILTKIAHLFDDTVDEILGRNKGKKKI